MKPLPRHANLNQVLEYLEQNRFAVILFVDQTKFCQQYANYSWVQDEAVILEVDQEIVDHFQIGKVPQYRFFQGGSEIFPAGESKLLTGTVMRNDFLAVKNKIFGNLHPL